MYHVVLPATENDPAILKGQVHAHALEGHLRWLRRHAVVLSLAEAVDLLEAGKPVPARATVLTFDDGLWNHAALVLPLLERYQVPATFFVSTGHLGSNRLLWFNKLISEAVVQGADDGTSLARLGKLRADVEGVRDREPSAYVAEALGDEIPCGPFAERIRVALGGMTLEQLANLARSPFVEIGAHTVSHPRLTVCSPERCRQELVEGRRLLEAVTGKNVRYFAYPEGRLDRSVVDAVRETGYEAAVAVESHPDAPDVYRIPRLAINADSTPRMIAKWGGLVRPVRRARRMLGLRVPDTHALS